MKHRTPAKLLLDARTRKRSQRDALRARGLRPRQVWLTDSDWADLRAWLVALRLGRSGGAGERHGGEGRIEASGNEEQGVS